MGQRTLFTIGYEADRDAATFIERLVVAGVERLIDVRELPLSRKKGFSKTSLSEALADHGIAYEHRRELGNPKDIRELYKSGRVDEGRARYTAHVQNGTSWAVDSLVTALQEQVTCVMCLEHDHEICHRSVIADEVVRRNDAVEVVNL